MRCSSDVTSCGGETRVARCNMNSGLIPDEFHDYLVPKIHQFQTMIPRFNSLIESLDGGGGEDVSHDLLLLKRLITDCIFPKFESRTWELASVRQSFHSTAFDHGSASFKLSRFMKDSALSGPGLFDYREFYELISEGYFYCRTINSHLSKILNADQLLAFTVGVVTSAYLSRFEFAE